MLLVGLGNPGEKYKNTRHNVGFMVLDALIEELRPQDITKSSFKGELHKANEAYLLKPLTFMNLSGESVQKVASFYKIKKIAVIHDDLDLPLGAIRFKVGGGHGGHNGLKSIDAHFGNEYMRIRLGIGRPQNKEDVANYVLSNFLPNEQEVLKRLIGVAADASLHLLKGETLESISNRFATKG